jgi:phosphoribosylaminoimidazole-succinocarboxamide synthase
MAADYQSAPYETAQVRGLDLIHQGKVRDLFAIDAQRMLMVASDRLSAFDVVLPDPIPGKGEMLTRISRFWFERTGHIIANHLADDTVEEALREAGADPALGPLLASRSMVVRRLDPLPVEAVVRGYLIGSGWRDYRATGRVCGIDLPTGLRLAERLPEILFTPSTKAPAGSHDENIDFGQVRELLGERLAAQVRTASLELYRFAAAHCEARGIIIADTKFEFGLDERGGLRVMDEVLTPDSSRFWPADRYQVGSSPPSFDKQIVRDYLETLDWDKTAPGPRLPAEVIDRTRQAYAEVVRRLEAPA